MAIQLSTETKQLHHERRTRNITIDIPETGPRIMVQRQAIIRDDAGNVIGRGEFSNFSFGMERLNTAARLQLMQDIADTVDDIEGELSNDE